MRYPLPRSIAGSSPRVFLFVTSLSLTRNSSATSFTVSILSPDFSIGYHLAYFCSDYTSNHEIRQTILKRLTNYRLYCILHMVPKITLYSLYGTRYGKEFDSSVIQTLE